MRGSRIFLPVASSAPAFNSTTGSTQTVYKLESSAVGRVWQGPGNRSVRLTNADVSAAFYAQFGTSNAVASTNSFLVPGKHPHVFYIPSNITHVSFVSTSDAAINVMLGYGGRTDEARQLPSVTVAATSTSTTSTGVGSTLFAISQAGSITYVSWLESSAAFSPGDAAHILWMYDYTSTST